MLTDKIQDRESLARNLDRSKKIVFTNGCFDILHAGHIQILSQAKALGDVLVVAINSDASVKRLKGESRPIHDQDARAFVLAALEMVDYVTTFAEDTPIETLQIVRPNVHVKGGDYKADDLPEAATVRAVGGEIAILPIREGFSTTRALEKSRESSEKATPQTHVMIPARYGSTRFPGKPLVELAGKTVIRRVVEAALQSKSARPVIVATDDERIRAEIETHFSAMDAVPIMTSEACHTGTDRLAEATRAHLGEISGRHIVVNVQGDEPFISPTHIDALIEMMSDESLKMATLATPIKEKALETDPNVVKAIVSQQGRALYFSRATVPYDRDQKGTTLLRHLGIYAYEANWLLQMAALPPSPLEEIEKLEQLRALENGVQIGVAVVEDVIPIAIDTPDDLTRAQEYLGGLA